MAERLDLSTIRSGAPFAFQTDSQPSRILVFLAENPEEAYTQTEIAGATSIDRGQVGAVLYILLDADLVEHDGKYWTITTDGDRPVFTAQEKPAPDPSTDFETADSE